MVILALALALSLRATAADARRSNLNAGDDRLADESEENDWLAYGRTHSERCFSPLTQINDRNVGNLEPDWYLDLPNDTGLVSTPLVIDGVRLSRGMPVFPEFTDEQLLTLTHYIRKMATEAKPAMSSRQP